MLTFLRYLALGLYQLPSGWKHDGDRKLNLSAILSVTLFFNLLSARIVVQDVLAFGGDVSGTNIPTVVIIIVMGAILLFMNKLVISDDVYLDIKGRSVADPERTRARTFFLGYLSATILFLVTAVVLLGTR